MLKNLKKKTVVILVSVALLVGVSVPAIAAGIQKQILVEYGIGIEFNEIEKTLTDVNGKVVEPFVYQGTTYVPLRGVSELFGAYVDYDAETDTAIIYDDFSEICAIVNKMNTIVGQSYALCTTEMALAGTGTLSSCDASFKDIDDQVNGMFDALETVIEDNANYSLIRGGVFTAYSEYIVSFSKTHSAYNQLRTYKSDYYADKFFDCIHENIGLYYAAINQFDKFFHDYAMYRDLGF